MEYTELESKAIKAVQKASEEYDKRIVALQNLEAQRAEIEHKVDYATECLYDCDKLICEAETLLERASAEAQDERRKGILRELKTKLQSYAHKDVKNASLLSSEKNLCLTGFIQSYIDEFFYEMEELDDTD